MEQTYEALKTILIEHLQDELDGITADNAADDLTNFGEGLEANAPEASSYYLEEDEIEDGAYPAIVVEFSTASNSIPTYGKEIHGAITIWVHDLGDGRCQRLTRRYIEAIQRVLRTHKTLDGAVKGIVAGDEAYGAWKRLPDNKFFRVGSLEIAVKKTY